MGDWSSIDELDEELDTLDLPTWGDARRFVDKVSDFIEEYQGIPVPLYEDMPLVVTPGHPMEHFYEHRCTAEDVREDERVVNRWFSRKRNVEVFVLDRGGRRSVLASPVAPDRSMDRLRFQLNTIGAADAWELDAEHKAREHLRRMLSDRQWRQYDLVGAFFETSPRSGLTYVFRRSRPTIVLSPRGRDGSETMRCLAVLCLHPIGYYSNSWGGCMVPSDDVIAHVTWMRADEARFWGKAVQHQPHEPEAGL